MLDSLAESVGTFINKSAEQKFEVDKSNIFVFRDEETARKLINEEIETRDCPLIQIISFFSTA